MSKKTQLSEKHWQALKLLEGSEVMRKDVAKACGWTPNHLDQLCSGNIEKCGNTATLFKMEYLKIAVKNAEETKLLVKENVKAAQSLIKRVLAEFSQKKKLDKEDKKLLSMYTNALSKCQPNVSIGKLSYSYTKGLTPEELIHEFKRLKAISEGSSDSRGVSETLTAGSGELSEVDE